MSNHSFHEIYLHINWHVEYDRPVITSSLEPLVHGIIRQLCVEYPGIYFHGIGGTETHAHVAISIEPTVCISEMIGRIKGRSSHDINAQSGRKVIDWQRGFGVVSFSKKDLPWVLLYIANQKEHHAKGTISPKLEWSPDEEAGGR
ncbi:MAG: IS200/IS605 family transposase [Armatimonadota bacterium]